MADYAIGDVQGCYEPLMRLLDRIQFDDKQDRLWFVGDLVNRGPQSLEVLRFIKNLLVEPRITLGNHDLHLLGRLFAADYKQNADDSLDAILHAPDAEELGHWLRKQNILFYDPTLGIAMSHAGIAPFWNLEEAQIHARELEQMLAGDNFREFLNHMYGNQPDRWADDLVGMERLRVITNAFTRMRFCDEQGRLVLTYKGALAKAPADLYPWYSIPGRKSLEVDLVFGHWAALQGQCPVSTIYAIDTGCLWGGRLTALHLQSRERFSVEG